MFYLIVSLQNKKITINKYKKVRNVFYELFLYQMFFSRTAEPLEIMKMIN